MENLCGRYKTLHQFYKKMRVLIYPLNFLKELLRGRKKDLFEQYGDLVTVEELAEMLCIGKNAAYKLLASGHLNCFRLNRRWKIPKQSVVEYVIRNAKTKIKKDLCHFMSSCEKS